MNRWRVFAMSAGILAFGLSLAHAQLDTAWARRYDGGRSDEDWVSDMYVDPAGCVYLAGTAVTGASYADIVVQKYLSDGTLDWTAVYDGAGADEDSASALAVDAEGNVYVCGWCTEESTGLDLVTIKYDSGGTLVWASVFGREGTGGDGALDICLDGSGRVLVTGFASDTSVRNIDYCTISYDSSDGDTNWVRFYNRTPENEDDVAVSICCDGDDYAYVTGYSYDDGTDYDIATVKYRSDGERVWTRRFNNRPWLGDDYGAVVVYDPVTNSVLVGGTVYHEDHDYDYFTIKYSLTGDSLWARAYNRYPANGEDILSALTVDAAGNVYVTGTSCDDYTDYDICTVRYAGDGAPIWTARYDIAEGEDGGTHLVTDSLGHLFVTGYAESNDFDIDLVTIKYDTGGAELWSYRYNNPTADDEDFGCRVAVQPDGYIYVSGSSVDYTTDVDFVLFKYYELFHDIAVLTVIAPESLWVADSLVPRAVVKNRGMLIDSCWVKFTNEWADYAESSWVNLLPGAIDTVQFSIWHPETTGAAMFVCWSELAGDQLPANDTAAATVIVWDDTSGVAEEPTGPPARFDMELAPNPAASVTLVKFWLPAGESGTVKLYDATGALVAPDEMVCAASGAKPRWKRLDLRSLPCGVYFLRLSQGENELSRKLVVQR